MTKATDKLKHLTGDLLTVSEGQTMTIKAGSMVAGRDGARVAAESLHLLGQRKAEKEPRHSFSSKAILPNLSQTVQPTGNQTFKYMSQ